MKISPQVQEQLLALAQLQLRYSGPSKPLQSAAAKELAQVEAQLAAQTAAARTQTMEQARQQLEARRLEQDLQKLKARIKDDEAQLGAATDPEVRKDLQFDLKAARVRVERLERRLAGLQESAPAATNELQELQARKAELVAQVEAEQAAAATKAEQAEARITELMAGLDPEVLAQYEAWQEKGIGIAQLSGRVCGGCHLQLPPGLVAELRSAPVDEMPACPECDTLLVR